MSDSPRIPASPHLPNHDHGPLHPLHSRQFQADNALASSSEDQPRHQLERAAHTQPRVQSQNLTAGSSLPLLKCGPLLRYCGTDYPGEQEGGEGQTEKISAPMWRGSVLLVITGTIEERTPVPELMYTTDVVSSHSHDGYHDHRDRAKEDEGVGLGLDKSYHHNSHQHHHHHAAPVWLNGNESESGGFNDYGDLMDEHKERERRDSRHETGDSAKTFTDEQGITRRLVRARHKLLLAEEGILAYRFDIVVSLEEEERVVTYIINGLQKEIKHNNNGNNEGRPATSSSSSSNQDTRTTTDPIITTFHIPSSTSNMRIMFHSCNGFSVGTDESAWSGPALWNDICRAQSNPLTAYHVMIGGGDQIYSDAVRVSGPLKHWAKITNPTKRRSYPYTSELALKVNNWYRENYIRWYTTAPFADANGRIPQVNMWDDHDIIDGYGSYTDHFMRSPVFLGVGRAAWRYYMVFQHHTPPDGEGSSISSGNQSGHSDSEQQTGQQTSYDDSEEDPSWILSPQKGRYIPQRSRSIYARLGANIALLAVDARTERTRHTICPPATYEAIFSRLQQELTSSGPNKIKHLLILLGVPIAYPRLVWLETILRSPIFGALKFAHKRFGLASAAFNKFDGEADILDDLDDHWAARVHKRERESLISMWQGIADKFNVRVTILSGDVHLAAVGRFYTQPSSPKKRRNPCHIPGMNKSGAKEPIKTETEEDEFTRLAKDYRYTPNIISSAITNKPPPAAVGKLLARRNKFHRLPALQTEETLVSLFRHDVNGTAIGEKLAVTMPRRNYTILQVGAGGRNGWEEEEEGKPVAGEEEARVDAVGVVKGDDDEKEKKGWKKKIRTATGAGWGKERGSGSGRKEWGGDELRVEIRVEKNQKDPEGRTKGFGIIVPALER